MTGGQVMGQQNLVNDHKHSDHNIIMALSIIIVIIVKTIVSVTQDAPIINIH